jgi:uncharacterized protein (DUF2132 family)
LRKDIGNNLMSKEERKKDIMEGVTLKMMLTDLIEMFGYSELFMMTEVRSFDDEYPQFNKILRFIRKNTWAIQKIERIYRSNIDEILLMKEKVKK